MSSTNRGAVRQKEDFYETPAESIESLLKVIGSRLGMLNSNWIEPCAGHGRIIRTVDEWSDKQKWLWRPKWTAVELRPEAYSHLGVLSSAEEGCNVKAIHCPQDFLTMDIPECNYSLGCTYSVSISNPPFKLAMPIIEKSLKIAYCTIMLLRLNFLGSQERAEFHQRNPADIYVLKHRPNFMKGQKYWCDKDQKMKSYGGDSCEYAWFVWGLTDGGHWQVID